MESLQARCQLHGTATDVGNYLSQYAAATREADLPGVGNAYLLGGTARPRLHCEPNALRVAWMRACVASTGCETVDLDVGPYPLLFFSHEKKVGALTASLKNCYQSDSTARARVILDVDGHDNTKPYPSPRQLFDASVAMLAENTTGASLVNPFGFVFMLSMPGKERSAHVVFPELCFDNVPDNVLGKAHVLTDAFNAKLHPLGMQGDFSICNSGVRWEFGDKFAPNQTQGRQRIAVPFVFNADRTLFRYDELATMLDPRVLPADMAYTQALRWTIPHNPGSSKVAKSGNGTVRRNFAADPANSSMLEEAIYCAHPDLRNGGFKRIFQGGGITKLLPASCYCPFKTAASEDQPAFQHATPKLYIFACPDGSATMHCGVCTGRSLTIPSVHSPDDAVQQRVLRQFNSGWARVGVSKVMRLPHVLPDGEWHETKLLSLREFEMAADTLAPQLKINNRKMTEAQFWCRSQDSTRYPDGLVFDPSYRSPPSFYNTYRGFNQLVTKADATNWDQTRELIRANICNYDEDSFRAVIGFFTDLIQNPGVKPGWGLCIFGPQGCGKGLMAQFFAKIIGRRHTCTLDATALESQWNSRMMESLLVIAEEAVAAKEEKTVNMLKGYVTEDFLATRKKYSDDRESRTYMRMLMLSNSDAPVVIEDHDRRWLVLNARYNLGADDDPSWRQRIAAVVAERESLQGCAAFYQQALAADNSEFDRRMPCRTRARWEVRFARLNDYERYLYHLLCGGTVCGTLYEDSQGVYKYVANTIKCEVADLGQHAWQYHVPKDIFWTGMQERTRTLTKGTNASNLWRFFFQVLPESDWDITRPSVHGTRARLVRLPAKAKLRQAFCDKLGQPAEIFTVWKID